MSTHSHYFKKYEVTVDDAFVERYANLYMNLRSNDSSVKFATDLKQDPKFQGLDVSTTKLEEIVMKYSKPIRNVSSKVRDIYRSDLGELLLTYYFEKGIGTIFRGEDVFVIPIKNIMDRETNDFPGRGIDLIGYRPGAKPTLLLGEAKVSDQKNNPPSVVHTTKDSLYLTQQKYRNDKQYLLRKLANYVKKLSDDHRYAFSIILIGLELERSDLYEMVYGCLLVRDTQCVNESKDFGKLKDNAADFEPGVVHFVIPTFDKPIEETVNLFQSKVDEIVSKGGV